MAMGDSPLTRRVLHIVRESGMILPGETVLVAVSGGADSMALLCLLWSLRDTLRARIEAAHYEHGIRGEDSLADARFVEGFCLSRGIPFHMGRGDVPALAAAWRRSLEDAARQARYAFLEDTARKAGAGKIALGHQLEDQAETLLLRLVYGCGLEGLAAMRPVSGNRIRPLLAVPRAELEEYLRGEGITWREDGTNQNLAHGRNLLRHTVFPALRRLNPRVAEAMGRTADLAALAADKLRAGAEALLAGRVKRLPYGAFWLVEGIRPTTEAARAFAAWAGVPPLNARVSLALAGLTPGKAENLPGNWRALRTEKRLHLLAGGLEQGGPGWTEADFTANPGNPGSLGDGIREQVFDAACLDGAVYRVRQAGDLFSPLGTGGTQKLKQTLHDAGIDRPFRDLVPLLAKGNRVLWIVGLRPGNDGAVCEKTKEIVKIRYRGPLPWEM